MQRLMRASGVCVCARAHLMVAVHQIVDEQMRVDELRGRERQTPAYHSSEVMSPLLFPLLVAHVYFLKRER